MPRRSPGVESATIASNFPLGGGLARTVFPEGQDEASGYRGTLTQLDDIAPNFLQTLAHSVGKRPRISPTPIAKIRSKSPLSTKRWLNNSGRMRTRSGKRFHFFGETNLREVVGVARNTVVNAIGEEPQPLAYLPITQDYSPAVTMQVRTNGRPEAVIAEVRGQVQSLDTNLALTNLNTIGELIDQGLWAPAWGLCC